MAIRINLKGFIEFSSDLSQVAQDIADAIKEANKTFKEVGEEGAEIERYSIDRKRLKLELRSGRVLRAHDALLRLKNQLARRLGPKRVGVRKVFIEDLEVIISEGHVGESKAKELLKGAAEAREIEGNLVLRFRDLTDRDIRERTVDRAIKLSLLREEKVEAKAEKLAPFGAVIKRGAEKPFKLSTRVASEAERLGWIKRYPARGQWIYTPPMAALLRAISELLIERVAKPLGFKEWMFPRLMPIEVFKKLSTYVEHLPEGVFYVCVPPRDPSKFDEFKREYRLRRELRTDLLKEILSEPQYVLEAIQCTPFYQFFSGEIVRLEDLPVKAYDLLGGWTWRNEAGGVEGIVRTNEFWRLEMVFLSSPEE
ncbi:MAG: serine--tRNA ligase, partial [Thaumarchaeota archaeon]